jgi:hypothetical protein
MSGALVVIWILGGSSLALLLLNAIFSGGSSAGAGPAVQHAANAKSL